MAGGDAREGVAATHSINRCPPVVGLGHRAGIVAAGRTPAGRHHQHLPRINRPADGHAVGLRNGVGRGAIAGSDPGEGIAATHSMPLPVDPFGLGQLGQLECRLFGCAHRHIELEVVVVGRRHPAQHVGIQLAQHAHVHADDLGNGPQVGGLRHLHGLEAQRRLRLHVEAVAPRVFSHQRHRQNDGNVVAGLPGKIAPPGQRPVVGLAPGARQPPAYAAGARVVGGQR